VKRLIILLIVGSLVGSIRPAAAQEALIPPVGGPPRIELPEVPGVGSGTRGLAAPGAMPAPGNLEPLPAGDLGTENLSPELQSYAAGDEYQIIDCEPALLESTGTWLRRGFWYTEIDALVMDLIWSRDDRLLASQVVSPNPVFNNSLIVQGGRSGAEVLPRLKLGRFLFRDHKNRDHAAEFIVSGGGQWTRDGRLDAAGGGTLTVNPLLTAGGTNPSFDGATSMEFDYDSRFNNFELNYHVKSRMAKDRMELEPSGQWVRRAQPSVSRSLMAGIRYFNLNESFDWNAFGIDDDNNAATTAQTGTYRVETDNDLIGSQLGFSWTYESARWSLGLQNKSGLYLNRNDVDSNFAVTGGVAAGSSTIDEYDISFITEGAVMGKWHLRPNFSLRAGLEILFVSSVAHASEQLNFIPVSTSQVVANGHSTFMGGTIGFEGYW